MSQTNEQASRDTAPAGSIRFNTDSAKIEIYNGEAWWNIDSTSPQEQTGGTRGIRAGGYSATDRIEFFNIDTVGNATDFGNLTDARWGMGSASDRTRAIFAGGDSPGDVDTIDFITFAQQGNAVDFGNLSANRRYTVGGSNSTRSLLCGGAAGSTQYNIIEYVTTQTTGNADDFGDLTVARQSSSASACSPTRTVISGGYTAPAAGSTIDYVTTSTLGNAANFGDKTANGSYGSGITSNAVRGLATATPYGTNSSVIESITIASLGNADDFGDLTQSRSALSNTASSTRAVFSNGFNPGTQNTMDYAFIPTRGHAVDFGNSLDTIVAGTSVSNGHGGLS